jgi:hypothetical protein
MNDDLPSHTLELLRALRADMTFVKEKVTDIDHHVIQLRISDAKHSDDEAHMFRRLRDYDIRKKRLDLRDE